MLSSEEEPNPKPGPVQVLVSLSTVDHHNAKVAATLNHDTVPRWIESLVNTALKLDALDKLPPDTGH